MASKSRKTAKPTKRRPEQHSETCLQMHCKQWLDKAGLWSKLLIFHVANERKGGIGVQMHFKRTGVRAGVADWLLFVPGAMVAIELKDDEGEQREDQERFEKKWTAAGGVYYLCRTVEDFETIVMRYAAPKLPWAA